MSIVWLIPALVFVLLFVWGWASSGILIKMPKLPLDFIPKSFGFEYETFHVQAEDGIAIEGWFVPARQASSSTVVVLHGWGATRSDVISTTLFLADRFNVAYFDFRNHGKSGGKKTSLTCLEIRDFEAVVRYLKKEKPAQSAKLGALGFSMGGSVALSGAAKLPEILAVAAESPFASFNATVDRYARMFYHAPRFIAVPVMLLFVRLRLGVDPERCSPIHHVAKIAPRPVLIVQGDSDPRMPVSEGRSLYEAAGEPKELWIVQGMDHIGAREIDAQVYERRIGEFFGKALK